MGNGKKEAAKAAVLELNPELRVAHNGNGNHKLRLGFFKYSCCAGCEFQTFFFQRHLPETLDAFDIVFARMVSSGGTPDGPFDVSLIEGTITEAWQVDELKQVRKNSALVFAIGACAVNGGIPAIKTMVPELEVEESVYDDISTIHSIRPHPIEVYIPVDGHVRGCPPGERDLFEALSSVITGKKPDFLRYAVCVECKLKGNICVLNAYNLPCMGPVTNAGCGALCPSFKRPCYSCFGSLKQANAPALAKRFRKIGLSQDDIRRKFTMFDSNTTEFRKAADMGED